MAVFESIPLVLIVEDDSDVLEIMRDLIEALGYKVVTAENGQRALNHLNNMAEMPCLILLDLMMPVMNGWEFVIEARKNAILAEIPVVVVSAFDRDSKETLNVAGRLRKPVTYDQLTTVVRQFCQSS